MQNAQNGCMQNEDINKETPCDSISLGASDVSQNVRHNSSGEQSQTGDCRRVLQPEWPTIILAIGCYGAWASVLACYDVLGPWLSTAVMTLLLVLHSSMQHEIIHGHPFAKRWANTLLGCPPLGLFVPFERFRDLHLKHHQDHVLTDPYDDPESNYLSRGGWDKLPPAVRILLRINNTLVGRMLIGPLVGLVHFYREDLRGLQEGRPELWRAYAVHCIGLAIVGLLFWTISPMPWWLYMVSAYLTMSVLKIRTFLEHRAHEIVEHRTAIVEDRGLLAFLFLNNNLHALHHQKPWLPWYDLPQQYRVNRTAILHANGAYVFSSYWFVIRRYFFRPKDPVCHPLLPIPAASQKRAEM